MGADVSIPSRWNPEKKSPELLLGGAASTVSDEDVLLYIHSVQLHQFEFPTELVLHIAEFIPSLRLLGIISLASKWLLSKLWASKTRFNDSHFSASEESLPSIILPKLHQLHTLDMKRIKKQDEHVLDEAIRKSTSTLCRINFGSCISEVNERTELELSLNGCVFPRLQELHANCLGWMTFQTLFVSSNKLRELTLPEDISVAELVYLTRQMTAVTPALEILNFPGNEIDDLESLAPLKSVGSLRRVVISPSPILLRSMRLFVTNNHPDQLEREYSTLRRHIDNMSWNPDLEIVLDLSEYHLYPASIYHWVLSSSNQALIEIMLRDTSLSQHQINLLFREFLVHAAHNFDYFEELLFIVERFLARNVDLSTPAYVPALGNMQTPFELLFRHLASRKLLDIMFLDRQIIHSEGSEPITRFQLVRKQNPTYPFFWAQPLYFACATGLSDPDHVLEVLPSIESDLQPLIDATEGAIAIGSAFKCNFLEYSPIQRVRQPRVAEYLLDLGVDPLALDSNHRWPALAYAAVYSPELLRVFVDRIRSLGKYEFTHQSGQTIFDLVSRLTILMDHDVMEMLLDIGQDPTAASCGNLVLSTCTAFTQRLKDNLHVCLRAINRCGAHRNGMLYLVIQDCIHRYTKDFADRGAFQKMHEQFPLLIDAVIDLHQSDPDLLAAYLPRMERSISDKTRVKVSIGYTLSVFALPESFIRLVSLARSAKDSSGLDSLIALWKQEHLFSSITHASSINLDHMDEYFQVATILSDLGVIDFGSFDAHMLDFLPNDDAIHRWHQYVASARSA